jgi:tetratricopeptide (TPR) repeat protein
MDYVPHAAETLELAKRAVRSAPLDPWAHFCAGYVHMVMRDFEAAMRAFEEAIELNPSMALVHVIMGSAYGYHGQWSEGLHHLDLAERMSPRDFKGVLHGTRGMCRFVEGNYELSIAEERLAVEDRPHFGTAWRTLAAAAGLAGRPDVAREALARCRELQPSLSLEWVRTTHAMSDPALLDRFARGLAAAGLT